MSPVDEVVKTPFDEWTEQQLRKTFGLKLASDLPTLTDWMARGQAFEASEDKRLRLEELRAELNHHARGWNEEELKIFFIGGVINLVHFGGEDYASFAGRRLAAVIDNIELSGIVDGMVASGDLEPISPFFCLHEYKGEKGREADPAGQLLAAMLAARHLNNDGRDLYGAYVIGRLWFFVVLDGDQQTYGLSQSFDASTDDIVQIFGILCELKSWIESQADG
jgi:hypothetical protein